jgi:hypothetical protein
VIAELVITASESDGGILALLAIGPAGALGLYWMLFRYYRNTDKSHSYERETLVNAGQVTGDDTKVSEIHGTQEPEIRGRNESSYRQRVERVRQEAAGEPDRHRSVPPPPAG